MITWIGRAAAVALLLALAACARPPPTPAVTSAPEPPPPPSRPLAKQPTHQVLRAHWSFDARPDGCTARAAAGGVTLQVLVRPATPVRLVLTLASPSAPKRGAKLHFSGPTGHWQVAGNPAGKRQMEGDLGADDTALGRVLVLLNGGVLEVGDPKQAMTSLAIPAGGASGQAWFDCARRQAT
jgi:hypothetical protein